MLYGVSCASVFARFSFGSKLKLGSLSRVLDYFFMHSQLCTPLPLKWGPSQNKMRKINKERSLLVVPVNDTQHGLGHNALSSFLIYNAAEINLLLMNVPILQVFFDKFRSLQDDTSATCFLLHCQKFIELVRVNVLSCQLTCLYICKISS